MYGAVLKIHIPSEKEDYALFVRFKKILRFWTARGRRKNDAAILRMDASLRRNVCGHSMVVIILIYGYTQSIYQILPGSPVVIILIILIIIK